MNRFARSAGTRVHWGFAVALFGIAAATAACGGGGGSTAPSQPAAVLTSGQALLTIPNRATTSTSRRTQFVSASAVSVGIAINGGSATFSNISTTSTLCSPTTTGRTCTIPVSALSGSASFAITLYDAANGGGNILGGGTATQTIVSGTPFTVGVVVNGVIATLALSVSPTALPVGTAGTATISATAKDVDGNTIIGPGNYTTPITLTNSDTSGATTISPASLTAPGQTATLTYSGSTSATTSATVGAQVAGVPVSAIAPTVVTFGATTPTPTPSPTPTSTSSSSAQSCGTALTVPGTYTTVTTVGTYAGTTYTANTSSGSTSWITISYASASPTPVPTATATTTAIPSPTPTPTRTPQPVYIYAGTYQLQSGTSGCFSLITSQDGSALSIYNGTGLQGNSGIGSGSPNVSGNYTIGSIVSGTVTSLVVNNLSATGGSGTVSLSNGDSGTITLTARTAFALDEARKLTGQFRSPLSP